MNERERVTGREGNREKERARKRERERKREGRGETKNNSHVRPSRKATHNQFLHFFRKNFSFQKS